MKSLSELCSTLLTKGTMSLEDAMDFLKIVYPICENKPLDENITLKAFQSGFSSVLLQHYLNKVNESPYKFNLEITKLISKEGKTIKIIINDANSKEI